MEVPCAQQLCLIRRIVLAATGSLYTSLPLCKRTGIQARGRRAYTDLRARMRNNVASSLSLSLYFSSTLFFLPFFLFYYSFSSLRQPPLQTG